MNAAHLHIAINHIPILGTAFGALVLLVGLVKKSAEVKKTALLLFVISALAAIPAFKSGESAEDLVERLPGVSKEIIHDHEEAGETTLIVMEGLGALSLLGLILGRRASGAPNWIFVLCFLASLGASGVAAYTANLGGQIRHTEIRSGFSQPPAAEGGH